MILEDGRLRSWDRDNVALFDCPVTAVGAQLSKTGTLTLLLENRKWALVGRGAKVSPGPTSGQVDSLQRFWHTHPNAPVPQGVGGPGFLDALINEAAAWQMRIWHNTLIEAGAHQT